jgi:GWxTD domain-containing protein
MRSLFLLVLSFVFAANIFAQDNISNEPKKNISDAVYFQDYVNFASDKPGFSRVDVFIQVPYKNVKFVKSNQGFTAKYSITASVFDSSGSKLIVEKTWNETINVIDYNLTITKENYNLSKRSFELSHGKYKIKTIMTDKDSKQEAVGENSFVVKSYDNNISISDLLLISKADSTNSKSGVVPNISRNYPSSKDRVKFYFEIYLKDSVEIKKSIEYSVLNSEKQIIHSQVEERKLNPGTNQILVMLNEFPFDLGIYTLVASIKDSSGTIISSTKSFYSHWKGLPSIVKDIDKAIAQTVYIATPDEIDIMKEGTTLQDKTKRFLEFWKKKDPSKNNDENEIFDEYFRRIAYADENFSNYSEGWKSDRGMVYTILGVPNNVDRHPFEYDSKPYEVWEYYDLNRSFIFIDQTGFGDYRLVTPLSGDLYRYRY